MNELLMHRNSHNKKLLFLGKLIDRFLVAFGCLLILTFLARLLFNIDDSPISIPQIIQVILGFCFIILGLFKKSTIYIKRNKKININKLNSVIGLFPFISFTILLIYRIQTNDIKRYQRLVEEGSLVEWLSFLFLLLASFMFFISAKKYIKKSSGRFLLFISGLTFFFAMEEMSWGQMIFNWQSPHFLAEINLQKETNFHNLIFIHGIRENLISNFIFFSLSLLCLSGYYLRQKNKIKPNTISEIIFPHISLLGYFSTAALIYFGLFIQYNNINIPILISSDQEIVECFFALGLLIHSFIIYISWVCHEKTTISMKNKKIITT